MLNSTSVCALTCGHQPEINVRTEQSPYRIVTTRRGSPGLPFGWEIHDAAGAEISRSATTFRSRHEASAEAEKAVKALVDTCEKTT
jgi:hypothetical protein